MRNQSPSTFALWLTLGLVPLAAAAFATGCSGTDGDDASASADALGACGRGSSDDADDDADDDERGGGKGALHANCGKARRDAGKTTTSDAGATPTSDAGTTTKDAGSTPAPTVDAGATPTTCTSFTYSAFGACQPNGTQTRTVLSSSPAGCTGGTPVLTQTCTYLDGAALYTQYCAGCHGTSKKGSSATSIQSAIDKNTGGMGSLKFLTAEQIQAISAAK